MTILRAIGDIHGCINNRDRFNDRPSYIELCKEIEPNNYSIQLGDMGFDYSEIVSNLNPKFHRFVKGNHDLYDPILGNVPHSLGDFGNIKLGPFSFYFIRGGYSIDKQYRLKHEQITGQKSWYKEEELTQTQGIMCLSDYEKSKPDIVFSHECPSSISYLIGNPEILIAFGLDRNFVTSTQELMQQIFDIHKPKIWCHGHYHLNNKIKYHGTTFMCIAERQYLDFNEQWEMINGSY